MTQTVCINERQEQIIIGKLLGDGHLETANGRTYRLKIEHSIKQKDYVDWLYHELYRFASSAPKIKVTTRGAMTYYKYWFNTSYSGSFRFYAQQFYVGRKKVVPKLIQRLPVLIVAISMCFCQKFLQYQNSYLHKH